MSHLLLDLVECQSNLINKLDAIEFLFDCICRRYDLTVLNRYRHEFEPDGVTLVYTLADSHFTIHTWPEKKIVSVDLYSCRHMALDMNTIAHEIKGRFQGEFKLKLIVDRISIQ